MLGDIVNCFMFQNVRSVFQKSDNIISIMIQDLFYGSSKKMKGLIL